jgi:hypothetical protein
MSLLSVVTDVALAVGVNPPTSLFMPTVDLRTQKELRSLVNEIAQRIAYDTREWTALKIIPPPAPNDYIFLGDGVKTSFPMPANYKRMLLSTQVRKSSAPDQALRFVEDTDDWMRRRMAGSVDSAWGEWILIGTEMRIYPAPGVGEKVSFAYLDKNCINLNSGGYGDVFNSDQDTFRLDERLLKLGMIWQWKANKGSPYAEDLSSYSDALFMAAGADKPAPIIVDCAPISAAARVVLPWPNHWGPQP